MIERCKAGLPMMLCVPCSWFSGSIMRTPIGAKPMTSPTPISTNNLDLIYTSDPVDFARAYLNYLQTVLQRINTAEIGRFVETLLAARERGSTVFFIGNGGSAATASHFANDLSIGTNSYDKPFRALSLTDNVPIVTAVGNDFGYEEIFVRQLRVLGKSGDVLVGISASGNSPNLLRAMEYAQSAGITTVAI